MIRINSQLLDFFLKLENSEKTDKVQEKQFEPGQIIIAQGKKGRFVHIVKRGITKCYVSEENGKNFVQEFFGEGELLGEIEVLNDTLSFSNVIAMTNVTTYSMGREDFYSLMENSKEFNLIVARALAIKLTDTAIRASRQQSYPIEHNLNKLMELSIKQSEILSKTDIANYLGITVRSLNRTLKKMEKSKNISR